MKTKQSTEQSSEQTTLGQEIISGMKEILAHIRGEIELPTTEYHPPAKIDVAPVRKKLGLTQIAFANTFGLQVATIRDWEQGRRKPEGAARILLAVIDQHPAIVQDVLKQISKA